MSDIANDRLETILSECAQNHAGHMHESRGNFQSASNVLRHSASRKFDQIGPMEAAASEVVLRLTSAVEA